MLGLSTSVCRVIDAKSKKKYKLRQFCESRRDLVNNISYRKLSNQLLYLCVIKDNVNHFLRVS